MDEKRRRRLFLLRSFWHKSWFSILLMKQITKNIFSPWQDSEVTWEFFSTPASYSSVALRIWGEREAGRQRSTGGERRRGKSRGRSFVNERMNREAGNSYSCAERPARTGVTDGRHRRGRWNSQFHWANYSSLGGGGESNPSSTRHILSLIHFPYDSLHTAVSGNLQLAAC